MRTTPPLLPRLALRIAWVVLGTALAAGSASAATYYVAVGGDDAGAGTLGDPFATFAHAAGVMVPGDTTLVRGGTYNETLRPAASGQPGLPLTWAAYAGETPVITDVPVCINLNQRSHVVIDGLTCDGLAIEPNSNVSKGATISKASYDEIRNSTFRNLTDFAVTIDDAHHNVIRDNIVEYIGSTDRAGGDGIAIRQGSGLNLVEGNDMSYGGHNLVQIIDSPYNIVRGNVFTNPWWKAMGTVGESVRHLIVEDNEFFGINVPGNIGELPPGIAVESPENLIRRNLFYENVAEGITMGPSADSPRADHNRIVHNVFYQNGLYAWHLHEPCCTPTGATDANVFANNIAFDNGIAPFPLPDPSLQIYWLIYDATQLGGNQAFNNLIRDDQAGEQVIGVAPVSQAPLSFWQTNYPAYFWGNIEDDPLFTNAPAGDFTLPANSKAVNAGSALTVAAGAGSGDELVVDDASFFSDGYGLVPGDWIQLEGGGDAIVCRVDYASNTLTLDRSLSWSAGQGVAYAYAGTAPDMGAFERNLGAPPASNCPQLPALPACSDRIDNDFDQLVDFPDDTRCVNPADGLEGNGCGMGGIEVVLVLVPAAWLRGRRRTRAARRI